MNDVPPVRGGRDANLFLLANDNRRGGRSGLDARHHGLRLNRRGFGQRVGGRQVDARFGLRLNGGLWCQRAVHPQPERYSSDYRDCGSREERYDPVSRTFFGRRLTSSVSQGSRSKSRAIVSPIGSAHLLGGSHAHEGEATAYDLPNS